MKHRTLHKEEQCDLHRLFSTVTVVKFWKLRWTGHVSELGKRRNSCINFVGGGAFNTAIWKAEKEMKGYYYNGS